MSDQNEYKILELYTLDYPFETLINRILEDNPRLILDSDFQREYKWDEDGWERASKFIESCLMRIPLPSCYFAEKTDGKSLVIDGVQRLTTITKFYKDEFPLEGMSAFKELEGKFFSELGQYKSEFLDTSIRCIILRKENPPKLIREIFSRLNQGAVKLSPQEIRHAIYPGNLDKLLTELSEIPLIRDFQRPRNPEKSKNSREAEEQVLRFFAFAEDFDVYEGKLGSFLNDYMDNNSNMDDTQVDHLKERFTLALTKCEKVFGSTVFCDTTTKRVKQSLALYDLLMPSIGDLDQSIIEKKSENIREAFIELCKSQEFRKTLSGGTQNKSAISRRRKLWKPLLEQAIYG